MFTHLELPGLAALAFQNLGSDRLSDFFLKNFFKVFEIKALGLSRPQIDDRCNLPLHWLHEILINVAVSKKQFDARVHHLQPSALSQLNVWIAEQLNRLTTSRQATSFAGEKWSPSGSTLNDSTLILSCDKALVLCQHSILG
jgi:hypothetical protein